MSLDFVDLIVIPKMHGGRIRDGRVCARPQSAKGAQPAHQVPGVHGDKTLQSVIHTLANRGEITLCLAPGVSALPKSLVMGPEHSNLTIEACHDGAVIRTAQGAENNFLQGLVILNRANNVTFRGLRFELPQAPFAAAGGSLASFGQPAAAGVSGAIVEDLFVSIGLRPVHCALLRVQDCLFRFTVTRNKDCFGVGIFAASECWGLKLIGNRFVRDEDTLGQLQPDFQRTSRRIRAGATNPQPADVHRFGGSQRRRKSDCAIHRDRQPVPRQNAAPAASGAGAARAAANGHLGLLQHGIVTASGCWHHSREVRKMLLEDLATLATALFSGAAVYITLVEHPVRMSCTTQIAVAQWRPSYHRATLMQASLAVMGTVLAIAAWLRGDGLVWLLAGVIFGAVIPFTLLIMWPTNKRLEDERLDISSAEARNLLVRWGELHTVRSVLGLFALSLMLFMRR